MTTLDATEIYLAKRHKVILPTGNGETPAPIIATIAKNIQSLGFGLGAPVLEGLSRLPENEVVAWYEGVVPILQRMVGAHRTFEPMYPNFPEQVMKASDAELLCNAMMHYFGFWVSDMLDDPKLVILPRYEKKARPILGEFHDLRWIDLGSPEDFNAIFTQLAGSNGSLSEFDRDALRWFATTRDVQDLLPEAIPQKETLAFLFSVMPKPESLRESLQTATDVLRVAVALSEGDVSLAEPTRFRSFSKKERRFLLGRLNEFPNATEDMLRWKSRWIRLGERLHPGDYKKRFPQAFRAFQVLRNDQPFATFNHQVEKALSNHHADELLKLLSQRPGDFARRLDHVLRTNENQETVLATFLELADRVSTPVLLQAWCHFQHRDHIESRAFFPKGNAAKVQFKEGALPALQPGISEATATGIRQTLNQRFSELSDLGKVYLDPRLAQQFVPFSQRSASRSLRSIVRGSRFDLPPGNTVRFFCWWKNIDASAEEKSRVDLDLSASLFKSDWSHAVDIAYYNLKEANCYHSGDITSVPEGACEFIDISMSSIRKMEARYVVMSVLSYTGQPFVSLPECFGGWMIRIKPNSGEIFEPKTVQEKIDITANTRACVPVILDVETRQVFWADLGLKSASQINNAAKNAVGFSHIGRSIVELTKPTLRIISNACRGPRSGCPYPRRSRDYLRLTRRNCDRL